MWGSLISLFFNFEPSLKSDQNALGRFLIIVCVVGHLGTASGSSEGRKGA